MITMIILLAILVITFVLMIGAGLVLLQMFSPKKSAVPAKNEENAKTAGKPKNRIRWSYFILPALILLASIVITIYFYGRLPNAVVWRLNSDNSPTISRLQIALWAIVPQLLLTLLAVIIAYGSAKIGDLFGDASGNGIKLDAILMVMSNMVIIPQLILIVAILNIFNYNSFQTHVNFVWWVSLAIILVGVVFLSVFFVRLIRKMGNQSK